MEDGQDQVEGTASSNSRLKKRRSSIQSDSFVVIELEEIKSPSTEQEEEKGEATTEPATTEATTDIAENEETSLEENSKEGDKNQESTQERATITINSDQLNLEEPNDEPLNEENNSQEEEDEKESVTRSKKLVPVWYLFRFAKCIDIFMIILGTLTSMAAGCALPAHVLMFGDVIDLFISHDLGSDLSTAVRNLIMPGENFTINPLQVGSLLTGNVTYFCNFSQDTASSNIFRFFLSTDPNNLLESDVTNYSYYYLTLAAGMWIASFLSVLFWNMSAYRQTRRMRLAFFRSIMKQSIGWFEVNPSAELSTRLAEDIEKIQSGIGDKAAVFVQYFTTFIAGFVIAFVRNWKLALALTTMLPVLSFLAGSVALIIAKFTVREQNAYASAGAVAEEVFSSIKTVLAFGGENKEIERYQSKLKKATSEGFKKSLASSVVFGILISISFITFAIGFWYGSILISNCELRAGQVVTVFFGVVIGSYSLGNSLPELQTFAAALGSATGVFAVIDHPSDIDATQPTGEIPQSLQGNIQLNDVIFTYPARPDVQVLNKLNLSIKHGQTVALVGPSGCGKSTVVQLLQRFYNPDSGEIIIDNHRIEELNLKWLRSNIGVVSQEPVLFDATIAENISHGKEGASMEEIEAAAKAANAHNFISELPDKYNTLVGERGTQLSGGQKQRIAIARALVRDPKILLLDEATSALDTESEKIVQDALDKAREGRTTIVIAHRLSTIQQADVIVGIDNGQVVEAGTHRELMRNHGLYHELVTAQTVNEEEEKSTNSLSGFKVAMRRKSINKRPHARQRSNSQSASADPCTSLRPAPSSLEHQTSVTSENVVIALTDSLSPISLENIPVISHPSPSLHDRRPNTPSESPVIVSKSPNPTGATITVLSQSRSVHFNEEGNQIIIDKRNRPHDETDANLERVPLKELLKLNLPDWYLVISGIISSALLGSLFPLMAILFSTLLEIFSTPDREELLRRSAEYSLYFVLLAIGAGFTQFLSVVTLGIAGERVTTRLRILSFKSILRQEIGWFDRNENSTGALAQRLATDASEVKGVTGIRFGVLLQLIFGFFTALIIGFTASWLLSIVLFISFPIIVIVGYLQTRVIRGRSVKNKELMSESGRVSTEAIDNIRTVVSLGVEDTFYNYYDSLLLEPFRTNMRNVIGSAVIFGITQGLIFAIYAAGFRFGVFLVISDPSKVYHATYDDIFRVFSAVVFTALTMGRNSSFGTDLQKAHLSASRVFALVNRQPDIDNYDTEGEKLDETKGHVEVKNISFNYPARPDVPVLQGLSISVEPGQTLALVGPSGCGKSTVVSLVERFYDPLKGCLLLEGKDLRDLNIRWLRQQIGIVSQEPVLFDKSIADNIRYGANFREVSDEEVVEAAKAANIHNFIQTLPQGYGTNVGSKGTQLSGGQKQRIAIARALVRDPKILLLDEATSALDTESEKIVQDALDKAREGRTTIVIAHRLSTIYNSNCIAVIHNGQVIETGTHAQLMSQNGAYYLLNTVKDSNAEEEERGKGLEEMSSL